MATPRQYDNFEDGVFDHNVWSVPTLDDPVEIRECIDSLKLIGRKIKRLRLIGFCYDLRRDDIEEYAYIRLKDLEDGERSRLSDYDNIDPEMPYPRSVEVDEPLLIEFEDGDVLEIEAPRDTRYCMSINHIPWWIDAGTNKPNADANVIFSPCIGREIQSVDLEIYVSDKDPMYGLYESERELVSRIIIRLDNGEALCVGGWIDYCHLAYITANDEVSMMPIKELKNGLFNWEDIHDDDSIDFESWTPTFFFGEKGAEHVNSPFMTLSTQSNDSILRISVEDFLLFEWSIIIHMRDWFDEYDDYEFDQKEWHKLLSYADKLLSFESFDALFDYLIGLEIKSQEGSDVFLYRLNNSGVEFWRKKDMLAKQLSDMREWSDMVLNPNDRMRIQGC